MRKAIIAAGLASCLALGGCAAQPQEQKEEEKEVVYDKDCYNDSRYYDMLKQQAQEAESVAQTAENTIQGTPDPTNNVFESASWVYDERYTSLREEEAEQIGSDTDWFASVDRTLGRATVLYKDSSGSWNVVAAFDCGIGLSEKELGISDSTESHTFTGVFTVDHKCEQLGGLKWWVCFIPCWTEDGLDDGQGFHNLYLGYPGPQSNGCTRLSDTNAKWMYDNLSIGSTVYVW